MHHCCVIEVVHIGNRRIFCSGAIPKKALYTEKKFPTCRKSSKNAPHMVIMSHHDDQNVAKQPLYGKCPHKAQQKFLVTKGRARAYSCSSLPLLQASI